MLKIVIIPIPEPILFVAVIILIACLFTLRTEDGLMPKEKEG